MSASAPAAPPVRRTRDAEPPAVLLVHERYLEPGGEDRAFAADAALLRAHGHRVATFEADHAEIGTMRGRELAHAVLWNGDAYRRLRVLIRMERPAVVHFHNTFPLLSPAAYRAARDEGVPVVQTLHNYRVLCPNGLLYHAGRRCEACLGKGVPWPAVAHACYRGSVRDTLGAVAAAEAHRAAGTWRDGVDVFVALSEFARAKFVQGGLPAGRIAVRPNFLADDPGSGAHEGGFALFAGRLSEEKGVRTLLRAWEKEGARLPLKVAGTGPLEDEVKRAGEGVEWLGARPREEVLALMRDAAFLVFPSECYENFPLVMAEAFAAGLPVLAADGGAAEELVARHRAGLTYRAGDAYLLAAAAGWLRVSPARRAEMGAAARAAFLTEYTADRAYARLREIYGRVLAPR